MQKKAATEEIYVETQIVNQTGQNPDKIADLFENQQLQSVMNQLPQLQSILDQIWGYLQAAYDYLRIII